MAQIWDQLVECIVRPPRDSYSPHELLGGSNQTFFVGQMECTRIDFELTNKQGLKLVCSHYLPLDAKSRDGQLPVVVYCHCNSGSRRDAEEAVYHLLPCGVGVVAFDFTGSGLSDGKWVTLGAHEVDDLAAVVAHLRAQGGVSSIGLWGRSMGAVTALLYSHMDPDIAGMVLDSPFSRLTDLMLEIVVSQRLPIPKVMLKLALRLMRSSVRRKAGADITAVSPLDVVARAAIPAMFGHGEEDSFISMEHSVKLYEAYNSAAPCQVYKNLVRFKGDHNHPRPAFFYSSVCCFFHQQLKLDQVLLGGNPADAQQLLKYGSLNLSAAPDEAGGSGVLLDRANGFITTPPWDLHTMASLSQEDHAAAAAAAAAALLVAAEAEPPPAAAGGEAGGSSSCSGGGSRALLRGGGAAAAAAAHHTSEGGLNSPRAGAAPHRAAVRPLLSSDDAGEARSSGSQGSCPADPQRSSFELHARQRPQHHTQQQQQPAGPQQQHHRQRHHHHHHQPHAPTHGELQEQHKQQGRHAAQAGQRQHAAAAAAAAGGTPGIACSRLTSSEELMFSIGSRGAAAHEPDSLASEAAGRASPRTSSAGGGAAAPAAALGAAAQRSCAGSCGGTCDGVCAAGKGAAPAGGAAAAAAAAAAAGASSSPGAGLHFKWPWRRTQGASTGGGSAAAAAAAAAVEGGPGQSSSSTSSSHRSGSSSTPADRAGGALPPPPPQQQQQQHGARAPGRGGGPFMPGSQPGGAAEAGSVSPKQPVDAVAAAAGEEEEEDPELAAAIAASMADQQQAQQRGLPVPQPPPPQAQRQAGAGARAAAAAPAGEAEEAMLQQAIQLSLAASPSGPAPPPQ